MSVETPPILKRCSKCGEAKAPEDFYAGRNDCKGCHRVKVKAWREANPERRRAYKRAYAKTEKHKAYKRAYSKAHPEQQQRYRNSKVFGLADGEYEARLAAQGGACAICGELPNGKMLAVDHDHATGRVRDLLCEGCNLGLGKFKDDLELLRKAFNYLERHKQNER